MKRDGPKTPPLPPDDIVKEVAAILRKARVNMSITGSSPIRAF
jgi:hypothetical protein